MCPTLHFHLEKLFDISTNLHSMRAFFTRVPGLPSTSGFGAASIDSQSYDTADN